MCPRCLHVAKFGGYNWWITVILDFKIRGCEIIRDYDGVTPRSQNTYLVAYSDFSIVFFELLPVFILYYELFIWTFCLGFGFVDSESALV